jgi:hypothetical protein
MIKKIVRMCKIQFFGDNPSLEPEKPLPHIKFNRVPMYKIKCNFNGKFSGSENA